MDGRMDGWMDGWMAQPHRAQGRRQGAGRRWPWGSAVGAPCLQPGQGTRAAPRLPPGGPLWGSFVSCFPSPSAPSPGCFPCQMDANGCLGALTPTRRWQLRQRGSEMPPSLATAPIPAAGAERRGGHCWGGAPRPRRPPLGPRLGRGAGAAFSLGGDSFNRFLLGFLSEGIFIFCTKPAIVNTFEEKLKKKPTKKIMFKEKKENPKKLKIHIKY